MGTSDLIAGLPKRRRGRCDEAADMERYGIQQSEEENEAGRISGDHG